MKVGIRKWVWVLLSAPLHPFRFVFLFVLSWSGLDKLGHSPFHHSFLFIFFSFYFLFLSHHSLLLNHLLILSCSSHFLPLIFLSSSSVIIFLSSYPLLLFSFPSSHSLSSPTLLIFFLFLLTIAKEQVITSPPTSHINESETLTLQCTATGYPNPSITWLYGDESASILSQDRRNVTESSDNEYTVHSTLIIVDVIPDDAGEYKCRAQYQNGHLLDSSYVTVEGMHVCIQYYNNNYNTNRDGFRIFTEWCHKLWKDYCFSSSGSLRIIEFTQRN